MTTLKKHHDVSTLIDGFENFEDVRETYLAVADAEIGYRGGVVTPEQAL